MAIDGTTAQGQDITCPECGAVFTRADIPHIWCDDDGSYLDLPLADSPE